MCQTPKTRQLVMAHFLAIYNPSVYVFFEPPLGRDKLFGLFDFLRQGIRPIVGLAGSLSISLSAAIHSYCELLSCVIVVYAVLMLFSMMDNRGNTVKAIFLVCFGLAPFSVLVLSVTGNVKASQSSSAVGGSKSGSYLRLLP